MGKPGIRTRCFPSDYGGVARQRREEEDKQTESSHATGCFPEEPRWDKSLDVAKL